MRVFSIIIKAILGLIFAVVIYAFCIVGYNELVCFNVLQADNQTEDLHPKDEYDIYEGAILALVSKYPQYIQGQYSKHLQAKEPHAFPHFTYLKEYWDKICEISKASQFQQKIDFDTKVLLYTQLLGESFAQTSMALYENSLGRVFAAIDGPNKGQLESYNIERNREIARYSTTDQIKNWDYQSERETITAISPENARDNERKFMLITSTFYRETMVQLYHWAAKKKEVTLEEGVIVNVGKISKYQIDPLSNVRFLNFDAQTFTLEIVSSSNLVKELETLVGLGAEIITINGRKFLIVSLASENLEDDEDGNGAHSASKLNLVDMAELTRALKASQIEEIFIER